MTPTLAETRIRIAWEAMTLETTARASRGEAPPLAEWETRARRAEASILRAAIGVLERLEASGR